MDLLLTRELNLRPIWAAVLVSGLAIAGLSGYDFFVLGRKAHLEGPPEGGLYFLLRSTALLACSAVLVLGVMLGRQSKTWVSNREKSARLASLAIGFSILVSLAFACLFLVSPKAFTQIALEDNIVEWTSAAALFLACGLAIRSAFFVQSSAAPRSSLRTIFLLAFAAGVFFVGMEEISWMQRIIGFETPDSLRSNTQSEANLHNITTRLSENLYYFGGFFFLIVVPFVQDKWRLMPDSHWIGGLIPNRSVLFFSAPLAGYNWDMWNIIPIQMAFYTTALILVAYAITTWQIRDGSRTWALATLAAVIFPQIVFLVWGDRLTRIWDPTEYKEFFIALGLLFYATQIAFPRQSGTREEPAAN